MYTTLISAAQLRELLASGAPCTVFDCSFDLMQPDAGAAMYCQSHIPGAVYVHLDQHLSAKGSATAASAGTPITNPPLMGPLMPCPTPPSSTTPPTTASTLGTSAAALQQARRCAVASSV